MSGGQPHILVVDDDAKIRGLTSRFLRQHGMSVSEAAAGEAMQAILRREKIDLLVLDIMLPGRDGLTLCAEVRATSRLPIVMLTAIGDETDRIVGLEMGADDYLVKPFSPRELLARIKAVLRRVDERFSWAKPDGGQCLGFGEWRVDLVRRELTGSDGVSVDLSAGEYELLLVFLEHPRRVLTREQILEFAQGQSAAFDRSVDVQVSRLRRKIEKNPDAPQFIKTIRGTGYMFAAVVERMPCA